MGYQIGGYTIMVERSRVEPLDMGFEDAMRFILTAGVSDKKAGRRVVGLQPLRVIIAECRKLWSNILQIARMPTKASFLYFLKIIFYSYLRDFNYDWHGKCYLWFYYEKHTQRFILRTTSRYLQRGIAAGRTSPAFCDESLR